MVLEEKISERDSFGRNQSSPNQLKEMQEGRGQSDREKPTRDYSLLVSVQQKQKKTSRKKLSNFIWRELSG